MIAGAVNGSGLLKEEGRTVAMVADGLNDAPALATANVGIAAPVRTWRSKRATSFSCEATRAMYRESSR